MQKEQISDKEAIYILIVFIIGAHSLLELEEMPRMINGYLE